MNLVRLALSLSLGIALALMGPRPAPWLMCVVAGAALLLAMGRRWWSALLVGALALGGACGLLARQAALSPSVVPENTPLRLEGVVSLGTMVDVLPSDSDTPGGQTIRGSRVRFQVERIAGNPIQGAITLHFPGRVVDLRPGDLVSVPARLFRPRGFLNPGLPDPRLAIGAQGIDWTGVVERKGEVRRRGSQPWRFPLRRWMHGARSVLASTIDHAMKPKLASFVRIMVLGERSKTDPVVEEGFRAAGATHALSVSGLHLAVVSALIFLIFTRVFSRVPGMGLWISAKALAALCSVPLVWCYTILTGEAVATLRSAWMATVVLVGIALGRAPALAASTALAAIVLLLDHPLLMVDVSFQLSFLSVMALGAFSVRDQKKPETSATPRLDRAVRWVVASVRVSATASLVTAPLVAHHFGEVTPIAPIGNLILVPVVELLVLPCGLFGSLLGVIHPTLGWLPLWGAELGAKLTLFLAELFRYGAPIWHVPMPTYPETAAFLAGIGLCLWGPRAGSMWRKKALVLGAVCLLVGTLALGGRLLARCLRGDMEVTFLDVGQGDAILLEGPRGFVALIDGGGRYDDSFDTGARIVGPVLAAKGILRIDLMVLSHPHPDHMNGLFAVLGRSRVDCLWTGGSGAGNPRWNDLMALAREKQVRIERPHRLEASGLVIDPLGPWLDDRIQAPEALDANDGSLVLDVAFAGRKILLTGDIEEQGEFELLGRARASNHLVSDILKVPHHGSRHSSTPDFIARVRPGMGVISAGRFNRFGLPNPLALARYAAAGVPLVRTDLSGAVTILVEETGRLSATCFLSCR